MPLSSYVYSRLALGALSSSKRWKKPIHSHQLFFAAAVWLVSPKRANTLGIHHVYITLCILYILFYIRVRVRDRVDFILFC